MWKTKIAEYIRKYCDANGNQSESSLDSSQMRGLESLLKKTKEGELIVVSSDKGNTATVLTPEMLRRIGMEAVGKDRAISEKEIGVIQRRLNGHARSLVKIFNIGESKGELNVQRCWNNASSEAEAVPLLTIGIKTHKPVKENGDPEARAIIGASCCTTSRPGDIIADVLEPVAWNGGKNASNEECQSTEEMLSMMEQASDRLEKGR